MIKNQNTKQSLSIGLSLWITLFCFTVVIALLFQKLILPNIPSMHAGYGLLNNDAIYFHQIAVEMAANIEVLGWSLDTVWPSAQGATGNVAVLAVLYDLLGVDPSVILPINAALHASSGVLIFLVVQLLYPGHIGRNAGFIAAILFVVLPSTLNWYAQVHKDGYAITGTLLVLYVWLRFFYQPQNFRSAMIFVVGSFVGALLILFVRPYSIVFLVVATAAWIAITALFAAYRSSWPRQGKYFLVCIFVWFVFSVLFVTAQSPNHYKNWDGSAQNELCSEWRWEPTSFLPSSVEKYAETAARTRAGLMCASFDAPSNIDRDELPNNVGDIVSYMPRVFAISLLAPFPDTWLSSLSMARLVGVMEIFAWYLLIPGFFLALKYNRSKGMLLCVTFALCYLGIYGFTIGNLGTLHRVRYPFLLLFMAIGVLGWYTFLSRKGVLEKIINTLLPKHDLFLADASTGEDIKSKRKKAVGSGLYVSGLTFLGFIGFFYRDILLANTFGLGAELDSFFVALLIPMTIVSIASIPLGMAFTPFFLMLKEKAKNQEVQVSISNLLAVVLIALSLICVLLYFAVPFVLPSLIDSSSAVNIEQIQKLTALSLPILLFSGPVIIGNAVLNALGKAVMTGTAQLVVPIVAILTVVIFGDSYGVQAAMLGMVVGQLINLLILHIYVKKQGFFLVPRFNIHKIVSLAQLGSQYSPLTASAFFVSIALLVNTMLAMLLPEGGVSVFNLGSKIVLLITGIFSAAITAVMLPYFSVLIVKNHVVTARRELSAFLVFLTCLATPLSLIFFVYSEQIVGMVFVGKGFGPDDVSAVSKVMQFAVIQIPFFACNVLLLKFAIATKHVLTILLAALFGLIVNIGASLFFMKYMGVSGVALGASISLIVSTAILVLSLARYRHIGLFDTVTLFLNWLLFLTLLVSVNFESVPGVIMTVFTYIMLLAGYSRSLRQNKMLIRQVQS